MLWPSNVVQSRGVRWVVDLGEALGLPEGLLDFSRAEVLANVVMVVPLGVLGLLSVPRSRWQDWAAYGFLGALAVELVQGPLLPDRSSSPVDVVANTLGLLLGAVGAQTVRRRRGQRSVGARR